MIKMITSSRHQISNCHNDSGFDSGSSPELFHHNSPGMGGGNQHLNQLNQDEAPMSRTAQYRKVSFYLSLQKIFCIFFLSFNKTENLI